LNYLWRHINIFPKRKWLNLLKKHGFEVLENRYYFSKKTVEFFDLLLPLSIPSFLLKRVTHKWTALLPFQIKKVFLNKLHDYYSMEKNNPGNSYGACILFKAKKIGI
jgi:hypothetical protein